MVEDAMAARDYRLAWQRLSQAEAGDDTSALRGQLRSRRDRDVAAYLAQAQTAFEQRDAARGTRKLRVAWFFDPDHADVRSLARTHGIDLPKQ